LAESRGLFEVALIGLEAFGVDRKAIGSEGKVGEAEQAGVAAQRGGFGSCERVPELLWAPARAKPEGSKTWDFQRSGASHGVQGERRKTVRRKTARRRLQQLSSGNGVDEPGESKERCQRVRRRMSPEKRTENILPAPVNCDESLHNS